MTFATLTPHSPADQGGGTAGAAPAGYCYFLFLGSRAILMSYFRNHST
jgi:hypothetical protein